MKQFTTLTVAAGFVWLAACAQQDGASPSGADSITAIDLHNHTRILSQDSFAGRAPGTEGGRMTVDYLVKAFDEMGLEPAFSGSFKQAVPLIEMTQSELAGLGVNTPEGANKTYQAQTQVSLRPGIARDEITVPPAEIVFAGYGISAPEENWNDFGDIDVSGKAVVVLVNDPGYARPDAGRFSGETMTYYGRWTYKYEEAARRGAAMILVVHEEAPAGYPWEVVSSSRKRIAIPGEVAPGAAAPVEGWIHVDAFREIVADAGHDFDALKQQAADPGFEAVPLGVSAEAVLSVALREFESHNVGAIAPGAARPGETVIYTAHWDHLGTDPTLDGDQIFNGALDNASGTAGLLELAEAFSTTTPRPQRSTMFVAVTAEESGLLGSAYFAANPPVHPGKLVAGINLDGLNIIGPVRDLAIVGTDLSELEADLRRAVEAQGRALRPEPFPEKGYYYRSDHFSLAKKGVPMLYTEAGVDSVEHGREWGIEQTETYISRHYHKPSDEYDPDWDLSGAVDDLRLFYKVGLEWANSDEWPSWHDGVAFKAAREKARQEAEKANASN